MKSIARTGGFRSSARGGDHLWRDIEASDLRAFRGQPCRQQAVAAADVQDAQAARRPDPVHEQPFLQRVGDLTEHALAPSRVRGGQSLKVVAAARVLRRHKLES
jgi:hypothetical protein